MLCAASCLGQCFLKLEHKGQEIGKVLGGVPHPCRIGCVFAIQTELFSPVSALELRSQMVQMARVLLT